MHSTILNSTNMTTRSLNNKLRTCLIDLKLSKKTPPNRAISCILCQTPICEDTCPTHVCMCPIHRAPAKHMSDTCPRRVPRKRGLHPIKTCFPFHLSSFHRLEMSDILECSWGLLCSVRRDSKCCANGLVHQSSFFFVQHSIVFFISQKSWLNHKGQLEKVKGEGRMPPLMLSPSIYFLQGLLVLHLPEVGLQ